MLIDAIPGLELGSLGGFEGGIQLLVDGGFEGGTQLLVDGGFEGGTQLLVDGGFEDGTQLLVDGGANDGSVGAGGRKCGGRPEVDLRCGGCCCCCGVGTSIFRNGLSGFVMPVNWFAGRP